MQYKFSVRYHRSKNDVIRNGILCLSLAVGVMIFAGCAARAPKPSSPESLAGRIDYVLAAYELTGTHWGIRIETDQGEILYRRDDDINVVPASTVKLLTTSSALVLLGPDYRIPTYFLVDGYIDTAGVLQGDLVIKGLGDPALANLGQLETTRLARAWADTLYELGLRSITGGIWGDGMAIYPRGSRMSWEHSDRFHSYGANVSALSMADNSMKVSVTPADDWFEPTIENHWPGSIPVQVHNAVMTAPIAMFGGLHTTLVGFDTVETWEVSGDMYVGQRAIHLSIPLERPEPLFLAVVCEGMRTHGIEVTDGVGGYKIPATRISYTGERFPSRWTAVPYGRDTLFVHWSPPLKEMIAAINSDSHNLSAELLIRHLGWRRRDQGRLRFGRSAAFRWLASVGLDSNQVSWVDGSGLARRNLLSPRWVVQLLQVMTHHYLADDFRESMSVMGRRGTLKERGNGTRLEGRVWAKTGTMSGVSCISGYLDTKRNRRTVFSIMVNGSTGFVGTLRSAQDRILHIVYDMY